MSTAAKKKSTVQPVEKPGVINGVKLTSKFIWLDVLSIFLTAVSLFFRGFPLTLSLTCEQTNQSLTL
jgi:hypothetical protein